MSLPCPDCLNPPCGISETIGRWSLTHTVPNCSLRAARIARPTSRVKTDAARPYSTSLAQAKACSSLLKRVVVTTGPKTSFWTISES